MSRGRPKLDRGGEEQHSLPMHTPVRQANRAGKKTIVGHFDPPLAKAVAILAVRKERSRDSLFQEAITDLLKKYEQQVES